MTPREVIRADFAERKTKNRRYSMRTYSADVGINVATISRVLAGKETLTLKQAQKFLDSSKVNSSWKCRLLRAFFPGLEFLGGEEVARKPEARPASRKKEISGTIEVSFHLTWIDVALLDLFSVRSVEHSLSGLSRALGVRGDQVLAAIEKLESAGLVTLRGERYRKTAKHVLIRSKPETKSNVRAFHREMIQKGLSKLLETSPREYERRLINSYVVATNSARIQEAKVRIQDFQKELVEYLLDGEPDCLYGLNSLFYPLTENLDSRKRRSVTVAEYTR